jgi:hypothetical protein
LERVTPKQVSRLTENNCLHPYTRNQQAVETLSSVPLDSNSQNQLTTPCYNFAHTIANIGPQYCTPRSKRGEINPAMICKSWLTKSSWRRVWRRRRRGEAPWFLWDFCFPWEEKGTLEICFPGAEAAMRKPWPDVEVRTAHARTHPWPIRVSTCVLWQIYPYLAANFGFRVKSVQKEGKEAFRYSDDSHLLEAVETGQFTRLRNSRWKDWSGAKWKSAGLRREQFFCESSPLELGVSDVFDRLAWLSVISCLSKFKPLPSAKV